jgi:ubiquinone/menaquinone biosynthesis C-methylase UbiE
MNANFEFDELRRETVSWWYAVRRKLLREAVAQATHGKREARVLDLGCAAQLEFEDDALYRVCNLHSSLKAIAFRHMEGDTNLVCSRMEELGLASNSLDAIVAGDVLQSCPEDTAVLREMRRVLKEGGHLCLTVPAYAFLWGEHDEACGNQRRYTISELRRKMTTCGLQVQRASYFVASAFLPLAVSQIAGNIFHTSISRQQRPHTRFANSAMELLLEGERHMMHYINFPFGTRIVCWAVKPAMVAVAVPAWERHWARAPLAPSSG